MTHKKSKITIGILLLKNIRYLQLNIYSLISFSVLFFFCYFLQFAIFLDYCVLIFTPNCSKLQTNFLDLVLAEINRSFQPFLGCL